MNANRCGIPAVVSQSWRQRATGLCRPTEDEYHTLGKESNVKPPIARPPPPKPSEGGCEKPLHPPKPGEIKSIYGVD